MTNISDNAPLTSSACSLTPKVCSQAPTRASRVLVPLITPYLYGMERAVIEAFDALRPDVEPHFVQSSRIAGRNPPIIQELRKRGFHMVLLPDKSDWESPARPHSIRHFFAILVALVRSNATILRAARGKNILYVPGVRAGLLSVCAALMFRIRGRRVVHHFHDLGTSMPGAGFWFSLVTDCVHNTAFGYNVVSKKFPQIMRKRNVVMPYILEVERQIPEDQKACRIMEGKRNLFFVGQISQHKGVDILLQAFKPIAREHQDVMLHLVGGCRVDFRRLLDLDLLAEPALIDRVKFWGYREDILHLLRSTYLYVPSGPPSRFHESFGRSVVEAMALGVPTVCFRSGALQEIAVHEKTGLVCDESAASLAAALNRFLTEINFRNRCGSNARRRYEGLYSVLVVRDRWIQFFKPTGEATQQT
jgi:glycosyltransferase involved in cell wall biosynthesis